MERAVIGLAERLRRERAGIRSIYWFGSWVEATATPSSDVDLCIIVEHDDRPPRDRVADYMPERFPQPLDLIVITEAEWGSLPERAPGLHRAIVSGRSI